MILSRDGKMACYMSGAILGVHASVFDPHILEIATKGPTFHQVQVEGDLARLGFTPKAVAPMADYLSKGRW